MPLQLVLRETPNQSDLKYIQQGIDNYNDQTLKEHPKECAFFVRDETDQIHGGIYFLIYSDSIHIIMLWVDEPLQKKGFGSKLLHAAEEEAIRRKCRSAYVDTFAFQAEHFYLKNDYRCIGKIPDLLLGHSRIFFKKDLIKKKYNPSSIENCEITFINSSIAEELCREITAELSEWFGIPEANERYARGMHDRTSIAASMENKYVGLITIEFPFPKSAYIYWMAVKRDFHNKNIGTNLLQSAEIYCREKGYQSITVETLSPKSADVNYLKTYQFYEKAGFQPLFESNTYGPEFLMIYMQKLI